MQTAAGDYCACEKVWGRLEVLEEYTPRVTQDSDPIQCHLPVGRELRVFLKFLGFIKLIYLKGVCSSKTNSANLYYH